MSNKKWFKVYITDTDGSERLGGTFYAVSEGQAKSLALANGLTKIGEIVCQERSSKGTK